MMVEDPSEVGQLRRTHAKSLVAPFLEFDLGRELELLHREAEWAQGQNARTLAKYPDLRVVLIALKKGGRMAEHAAGGTISILALEGLIRVGALGRTFRLPRGGLLTLEKNVPHDVEALEDSAFLLTVSWAAADHQPPSP
jgi:quercetin dioxygenase-like cupin family protein